MMKKCVLVFTCLLAGQAVAACSSNGGTACDTDDDCKQGEYCAKDGKCHLVGQPDGGDEDGSTDDGDGPAGDDSGPAPCRHDRECPPDKVCDTASGDCVDGTPCSKDYNCTIEYEYCHPDPEGQVCKKRSYLCEPCSNDYECMDPNLGDMCITYPDDNSFCGQACDPKVCPPGYVCDPDYGSGQEPNPSQCRCNTFDCGNCFVCNDDDQCEGDMICNLAQGTCVYPCDKDTDCAAGLKCHYYTGHCKPPCVNDGDCEDDLLICCIPGRGFCDADSTGRCRPEGCVLHSECLLAQGDSLGYCDKATNECMTGCRAADFSTINDCRSGMKCTCNSGTATCDTFDCCGDPGQPCLCDPAIPGWDCSEVSVCTDGLCEEIPCHERGDVSVACARNQVCCGWPSDGYTCPAETIPGECYVAQDPVCRSCSEDAHDQCDIAGYGYGEKGVCLEDSGDGNNYCHLGCRNSQDCPSTWQCDYTFIQGCDPADSSCEATATCETVYVSEDGESYSGCHCNTDADCPEDINGFVAHCETMQICDYSQDSPVCHEGKACHFAKACQCSNCCGQLASGG